MNFANIIFCLSVSLVTVNSAKILAYYPVPSISHQVAFRPLTLELVKRGHEVTVITTDPAFPNGGAPPNLIEIDLHELSYNIWKNVINSNEVVTGKSVGATQQLEFFLPLIHKITEKQMNTKEVRDLIENKKDYFDLLIIEAMVRPALAFTHIFKAPVILFSSFGSFGTSNDVIGAPNRPVLIYPTSVALKLNNLSIIDKLTEIYNNYLLSDLMRRQDIWANEMLKKNFGPDMPDLKDLDKNVNIMFLSVHPMWELNRPVPPGVIYVGGIHQKPNNELPTELKSYLDSSRHGVIYFSLGTNVSPSFLPQEKIQMMINVFSKLPYDILWKWDKDELPGKSKNIRISKWLPQSDLLKHPNVKLFIMQGGLQSTEEAITAGVPLLGMPMLGDQWFNVELYVHYKVGMRLDMENLTEENFKHAITTLITDKSYRKNMALLRNVMHDQPESALERAVWWTEHVIRHGGASHLRAPAANMSWAEYLDVELLLTLTSVVLVGVIVIIVAVAGLINFVRKNFLASDKLKKS